MKRAENGFSVVEIVLVIVVIGLMSAMGWLIFDRQSSQTVTTDEPEATLNQQQDSNEDPSIEFFDYEFEELGISINLLEGWMVTTDHNEEEGVTAYNWTIEKPGEDGKIVLSSSPFRGGFYGCGEVGDPLTAATITEVKPTLNDKLMFLTWSYENDTETNFRAGVVLASESVFRVNNDSSADAVANTEVEPGTYFFCLSEPQPGFNLKLNAEVEEGSSRRDTISAVSNDSSSENYIPLSTSADSYEEIKSMLTSIR